jgi:hypothetical protein
MAVVETTLASLASVDGTVNVHDAAFPNGAIRGQLPSS